MNQTENCINQPYSLEIVEVIEKTTRRTFVGKDKSAEVECFDALVNTEIYADTTILSIARHIKGENSPNDAGIPSEYRELYYPSFKWNSYKSDVTNIHKYMNTYISNYNYWKSKSKDLYICSRTRGSGKTTLAISLLNSIRVKYKMSVAFVTEQDFIRKCKEKVDSSKRGEYKELTQKYYSCDLLVFDDLGTAKYTDFVNDEVLHLLEKRREQGKLTIYTSNLAPHELEERGVNSRLHSRLASEKAFVLQMPEESIRTQRGQKENLQFAEELLEMENRKDA